MHTRHWTREIGRETDAPEVLSGAEGAAPDAVAAAALSARIAAKGGPGSESRLLA